jgi:hypothetical protein
MTGSSIAAARRISGDLSVFQLQTHLRKKEERQCIPNIR